MVTPVFLVPALGGHVFRYLPLARRLGDDQPVYAIAARGLADGEEPLGTLAEMVADYVAHIREVAPKGPYVLGGFCIGGNIALELARCLRAMGEEVPLVVLFFSGAAEPVVTSSPEDDTALMLHALAGGPLDVDVGLFSPTDDPAAPLSDLGWSEVVTGALGTAPVGAVVSGYLAETFGIREVILVSSLIGVIAPVLLLTFSPIRRLRTMPEPETPTT
jgi:thioesterase domain-containing protein